MNRSTAIVTLILTVATSSSTALAQNYRVERHDSVTISESEVRALMAEGLRILATDDGAPGDVACTGATFGMDGNLGVFTEGDGIVSTRAELDEIMAKPPGIYIVNELDICGTTEAQTIVGCNDAGRGVTVIEAGAAAIAWIHEHGHMKWLDDRICRTEGQRFFIMCRWMDADSLRVDTTECAAYRQQAGRAANTPGHTHASAPSTAPGEVKDIAELVRVIYVHGVPEELASRVEKEHVPELLRMLENPKEEPWRQNIVTFLGFSGDERAAPALIKYFQSGEGKLSYAENRGKRAVPEALGTLVRTAQSRDAMQFLITGLADTQDLLQGIKWEPPYQVEEQQPGEYLKTLMVKGLAEAATPEAIQALEEFQRSIQQDAEKFSADVAAMVKEALDEARARSQRNER